MLKVTEDNTLKDVFWPSYSDWAAHWTISQARLSVTGE